VGIARALAIQPDLLLFDEPTSGIDTELVGEVILVMRELARDGMVFIDHGQIVETGTPAQFFSAPATDRAR